MSEEKKAITSNQDLSAWDTFRILVDGIPRNEIAVRVSVALARRMMAEHEQDIDRMERAVEAIERLSGDSSTPETMPDEIRLLLRAYKQLKLLFRH